MTTQLLERPATITVPDTEAGGLTAPATEGSTTVPSYRVGTPDIQCRYPARRHPRSPEDSTVPTHHTPESIVIADTPAAILEWAARHIEHVGIHQGPRLFAGPGRTATLPCWPRGALEVAAGHGRGAAGRTYDWDRIDRARDQAFGLLAAFLTGHPVDAGARAARALHREVIDRWSAEPGRTAADAARAFRAAASAEHALS